MPSCSHACRVLRAIAGGEHHDHGAAERRRPAWICSASMKPSMSGMWASVRTRRKRAAGLVRLRKPSRASAALSASAGSISQLAEHLLEDAAVRGVVVDDQHAQAVQARRFGRDQLRSSGSASSKRTVKWKRLPRPTSLSTHIRPPISSTSREAMASPSPVPP